MQVKFRNYFLSFFRQVLGQVRNVSVTSCNYLIKTSNLTNEKRASTSSMEMYSVFKFHSTMQGAVIKENVVKSTTKQNRHTLWRRCDPRRVTFIPQKYCPCHKHSNIIALIYANYNIPKTEEL